MRVTRRGFLLGVVGLGVVTTPAAWYSAIYEPNDIEVTHRKMAIPNLPSRLDGMTAVQISDLHLKGDGNLHSKMVDMIRNLEPKPDAIFFTGDLVDDQSAISDAVEIFRSWQPPLGTWAVPGNWEYRLDDLDLVTQQLKAANVRYLVNESAQLEAGLWIAGVNDPSNALQDLDGAIKDIPAGAPRILLAHSPDIADDVKETRFGLILAGHTHGGQVNLPFFNGAWLLDGPSQQYVQGLYDVHGSPLYVNRGIGTTQLPVRIGSRPEITHFEFHAA